MNCDPAERDLDATTGFACSRWTPRGCLNLGRGREEPEEEPEA